MCFPISRPAGAERQIYAGNANDYIYITDGSGREHGFLHLEATVNATETPRRLKPINVYYHMFAGERPASLAAVRHHLDAARQAAGLDLLCLECHVADQRQAAGRLGVRHASRQPGNQVCSPCDRGAASGIPHGSLGRYSGELPAAAQGQPIVVLRETVHVPCGRARVAAGRCPR